MLIIEDQVETINEYRRLAADSGLTFVSPQDAGLERKLDWEVGVSIEDQLARFLRLTISENNVDLVLLDTDLSRVRQLQTHSSYKAALRDLGMPVCRYQKGGRAVALAALPQLQRTIRDGASAIWIPRDYVSGQQRHELVPRLKAISAAFKAIENSLEAQPDLLQAQHSPTEVLAEVLGDRDLSSEFLGYSAQNLVYFSSPEVGAEGCSISESKRYATRLGYWLFNYIIMFPGPILSRPAAAAYLNVDPKECAFRQDFGRLIEGARYRGPFHDVEPYYWRSKLAELVDAAGGDISRHPELDGRPLALIDRRPGAVQAYVCMISGEAISQDEAAVSPDWVPAGASEAKIKEDVLEQLGPLAGI